MAKVLVVPSLLTTVILGCHKRRKTNSTDSDLTCNVIWSSVGLQKKATHPTAECRRCVFCNGLVVTQEDIRSGTATCEEIRVGTVVSKASPRWLQCAP
jgi:hypothetical protein